ncbi:MAG: hypothetical protein VB089_14460 [Anaerolineaceae bacterium]|nr:hypothetical protein [Anaerolineaceae bacterium]
MDYGEVLSKAWRIIWKFKVLWIFGLLASCGRGGGGGGGNGGASYRSGSGDMPFNGPNPLDRMFPGMEQFGHRMEMWFTSEGGWLIITAIVFVILILTVLAILLNTMGRIGLIRGAWRADEGAERLAFGELWRESLPYFWRVLGLTLLMVLAGILLALVIVLPLILLSVITLGIGLICVLPLLCLMVPVLWFVAAIVEQAYVAIVGEDLGVFEGLKRGWDVTRNNVGQIIVMGLILMFGGAVIGFLIAIPAILIVLPIIAGFVINSQTAMGTGLIVAGILFLIYLPVALLASSILQAYVGTAWTLTFRRLTGRGAAGNIAVYPTVTPTPSQDVEDVAEDVQPPAEMGYQAA